MESTTKRITDYFGENVFNDEVMQEYMSLDTYKLSIRAKAWGWIWQTEWRKL